MLLKAKEDFVFIEHIEAIAKVEANKIARFFFSKELLAYCQKNRISCAVEVSSLTQAIFANHYQATYIIVPKKLAKDVQNIADNYLFDTKVLVEIHFEWEIEKLAMLGVDGVILHTF